MLGVYYMGYDDSACTGNSNYETEYDPETADALVTLKDMAFGCAVYVGAEWESGLGEYLMVSPIGDAILGLGACAVGMGIGAAGGL